MPDSREESSAFQRQAARARTGLLREFWGFLRETRKWWLLPILILLGLLGLLVLLGTTSLAPYIYAMF